MKCEAEGCCNDARFMPEVCVPVKGDATYNSPQTARLLLDMALCNEHAGYIRVPNSFTPELEKVFITALKATNHEPDFNRAYVIRMRLDDSKSIVLLKNRKKKHETNPPASAA